MSRVYYEKGVVTCNDDVIFKYFMTMVLMSSMYYENYVLGFSNVSSSSNLHEYESYDKVNENPSISSN